MTLEQIQKAYAEATSYPEIVRNLIDLGVRSYTVDAASDLTVFRFSDGITIARFTGKVLRVPTEDLDVSEVKNAIVANQKGESDYHGFMDHIARA